MIQLTIMKITGYGPWTLTLGSDREHELQMLQSKLYHKLQELFSKKNHIKIEAYPVKEVVDPTGAGDTFGGGLMAALSNDCSLNEGVIWGNAAASFCVEGFGLEGLKKMTLESFEERVEKIKTLL